MALSSFGSGEFAPVKEWSCSQHKHPQIHECDCSDCDREWECDECSFASWVEAINEDGSPKMRELTVFDALLKQQFGNSVRFLRG